MNRFIRICIIFALFFSATGAEKNHQQAPVSPKSKISSQISSVASKGETILSANFSKFNVSVRFITREVHIGKPSDQISDSVKSLTCCTYSRYPCSIVDRITITVNGKPIITPRSVFCGLSDLNTAEIKIINSKGTLLLEGGDASQSYILIIDFDEQHVVHKALFAGEAPDQPLEETNYHLVVIGE